MKNCFATVLVACFLIASCSSPQKNSDALDSSIVTTNRDSIQSPIKNDTTAADTLTAVSSFPTDWEMLTMKDGNYVIYEYCDANNSSIHIEQNENGYVFTHNLGQMAEQYDITFLRRQDPLTFQLGCVDKYNNKVYKTATIAYQKELQSGLAEWTWYNSDNEVIVPAAVYAEKRVVNKFPAMKEENCEEL